MDYSSILVFVGVIVAACIIGGAVHSGLRLIAEAIRARGDGEN